MPIKHPKTLAISMFVLAAACNELDDPSFDFACSGESCPWQLDEGHTRSVGTWNENDKALELLDTPTTISQTVSSDLRCGLDVELFGRVDQNARLTVGIDADNDGTVDVQADVPALDWESTTFRLDAPHSSRWRLVITKQGPGKAVLGHVFADQCSEDEE
jgi:hypothetical protein